MAYDGIFIKAQIAEIKNSILNEHISKITQKSPKEINFHIRKNNQNLILSMSANPNFPYILLSSSQVENTKTPPAFCMLLRKYLQGGTIRGISQIGKNYRAKIDKTKYLERIVKFEFENINENGDLSTYFIYFEIMGKYSNIVITDANNMIIDVLIKSNLENARLKPKIEYSIKEIENKNEILFEDLDGFMSNINETLSLSIINDEKYDLSSAISSKYAGLSKPFVFHEILNYIYDHSRKLKKDDPDFDFNNFDYEIINKKIKDKASFVKLFIMLKTDIDNVISDTYIYTPTINYKDTKPSDFYLFKLNNYQGDIKTFDSINSCLETFINEKYTDLNDTNEKKNIESTIKSLYTKLNKKIDIYKKDLAKCGDIEKYKNYGELVSVFGYNLEDIKDGILTCADYNHNDEIVKIPIDEELTVAQNVERYYDKYNKLKRTKDNAEKLLNEVLEKFEHLNSISQSMSMPLDKNDLYLIKEEIVKYFDEANKIQNLKKQKDDGNKRKNNQKKSGKLNLNIHHFKSTDGIDIYVGKNNLQNEYLTFTIAEPNDTWLHIKNATGSHVIVKKPYEELSDKTLIEAASLAAYYSERRNETKATVDYTLRKELKKVKGKAPGFCIYHKNYSINVKPEILVEEIA